MNHEDNHYYEFIIKIHKCEMASLILCFCMALIHGSNTVVFGCPRAPLIHTIPKYQLIYHKGRHFGVGMP